MLRPKLTVREAAGSGSPVWRGSVGGPGGELAMGSCARRREGQLDDKRSHQNQDREAR